MGFRMVCVHRMQESPNKLRTCWKISLSILIIAVLTIKSGKTEVQRLFSLETLTNRSHACTGNDEIILRCRGRGSNITWTATSDSIDIGRIIFFSSESDGTVVSQGTIKGILIEVDRRSGATNLVSELLVYTTPSMSPINITCSSESGSGSHLIAPPAIPDPPILLEPHQLQQMDSSSTSLLYYLQWEAPSNINDVDLGHYQVYANDTLVQRIHAEQRYALISLQEGTTTTIKVVAANKCGQLSNYSMVSIRSDITNNPRTTDDAMSTSSSPGNQDADRFSGSQQTIASLVILICTTLLVLFTQASM